jgi:hypothetical protein
MAIVGGTCKVRMVPSVLLGLLSSDAVVPNEVLKNEEDEMV